MKLSFLVLALFNICIFSFVFFQFPHLRQFIGEEDMLVEDLTAFFFLSAAFVCLFIFFKYKNKGIRKRLVLIGGLGLLAFLDELSFGERIFNISMPLIGSKKIDAVHDFFDLGFSVVFYKLKNLPVLILALLGLIICALVIKACLRFRADICAFVAKVRRVPSFTFIFISGALLLVAMTIDLDLIYNDYLFLVEELLEMNAGLALLFAAICAGKEKTSIVKRAGQVTVVRQPTGIGVK